MWDVYYHLNTIRAIQIVLKCVDLDLDILRPWQLIQIGEYQRIAKRSVVLLQGSGH